jgi:hypothetical protein
MKKTQLQVVVQMTLGVALLFTGCNRVEVNDPTPSASPIKSTPGRATTLPPTTASSPSNNTLESGSPPETMPPEVLALFESTVTPEHEATIGPITFTDGLDAQYLPLNPGTVFQNPVDHIYAIFSYDSMTPRVQWTALWYHDGNLVHFETVPWEGGSGGMAYSDWKQDTNIWLPGDYEVKIFIGTTLKASAGFSVVDTGLTNPPTRTTRSPQETPFPNQITSTWTPRPTLSEEDSIALVKQLILNQPDCRLPCWFGFTPGEDEWQEVRHFLTTFTSISQLGKDEFTKYFENQVDYYVEYDISGELKGGMKISTRDNEIFLVEIGRTTGEMVFQINQLLNEFGKPVSVFIKAFSDSGDPSGGNAPFILILLYPDFRMIAEFVFFSIKKNDLIYGCPPFSGPEIYIWSPSIQWTDQIIQQNVLGLDPAFPPRPLEDVTDLTEETFFLDYMKSGTETCIKTPISFWP